MQSQVRFNRVPEKVPGGFGAEPGQVQQGSGEGSGEGLGGFGAARSGSTGFRRFRRRFPVKVWEALFGAEPGQVQQVSGEGSGEGAGGAEPGQVQEGSGEGLGGFGAEPGLGSLGAKASQVQRVSEKVESLVEG